MDEIWVSYGIRSRRGFEHYIYRGGLDRGEPRRRVTAVRLRKTVPIYLTNVAYRSGYTGYHTKHGAFLKQLLVHRIAFGRNLLSKMSSVLFS